MGKMKQQFIDGLCYFYCNSVKGADEWTDMNLALASPN